MLLPPLLRSLEARRLPSRARRRQPWRRRRPLLEALEDRRLLATIVVNNPTDTPVTGQTDLREALALAATPAFPGADTIQFDPTLFSGGPQTITLTLGQLPVTAAVTITGPGANLLTIDGNNTSRIFNVNDDNGDTAIRVAISGLTLTRGAGQSQSGGAISNAEDLALTNSTLSGNKAFLGGGISNSGTLTLTNSTLSGNGALFSFPGYGSDGGGIFNYVGGTLTLTNSTLSGNSASGSGGGIFNNGTATLTNSTLSGNTAGVNGGGITNYGSATLNNTIVANSPSGADVANFASDTITGSHNLIETAITGGGSNTLTGTIVADPKLGPLQNNGGPTQTMVLLAGSPAINAGSNALAVDPSNNSQPLTTDQRGVPFARIAGGTVDIGAYEVQSLHLVVDTTSDVNNDNFSPGDLSLREAITLANAFPGADTISFDISGAGVHTISLLSALPTITDPVIIDGYTQPGASPNTLAVGDNAILLIELNGANAGIGVTGLSITAGSSTVRGLVINRFGGDGIAITGSGASNNVVLGNFIGTNAAGTAALGNGTPGSGAGGAGVRLGGTSNTIANNVISANVNEGIFITVGGNMVLGNLIGTNAAGTAPLGNGLSGITLQQSAANTIGGNVISGNGVGPSHGNGISLAAGAHDNLIQANLIGTDASGAGALPNISDGVFVGGPNNTIGGTGAGAQRDLGQRQRGYLYHCGRKYGTGQFHRHERRRHLRPGQRPLGHHPPTIGRQYDRRERHLGQWRGAIRW